MELPLSVPVVVTTTGAEYQPLASGARAGTRVTSGAAVSTSHDATAGVGSACARRPSKVAVGDSLVVKVKRSSELDESRGGADNKVVSGGSVSMVNDCAAGAPALPARSTARALSECVPSRSGPVSNEAGQ